MNGGFSPARNRSTGRRRAGCWQFAERRTEQWSSWGTRPIETAISSSASKLAMDLLESKRMNPPWDRRGNRLCQNSCESNLPGCLHQRQLQIPDPPSVCRFVCTLRSSETYNLKTLALSKWRPTWFSDSFDRAMLATCSIIRRLSSCHCCALRLLQFSFISPSPAPHTQPTFPPVSFSCPPRIASYPVPTSLCSSSCSPNAPSPCEHIPASVLCNNHLIIPDSFTNSLMFSIPLVILLLLLPHPIVMLSSSLIVPHPCFPLSSLSSFISVPFSLLLFLSYFLSVSIIPLFLFFSPFILFNLSISGIFLLSFPVRIPLFIQHLLLSVCFFL